MASSFPGSLRPECASALRAVWRYTPDRLSGRRDTRREKKTARDLTRDTAFGWGTWTWARLQTKTGKSNVFLYYFDEHSEYPADSPRAGLWYTAFRRTPLCVPPTRRAQPSHADPLRRGHVGPGSDLLDKLRQDRKSQRCGFAKLARRYRCQTRSLYIASGNTKAIPVVDEDGLKALDEYFAWRRSTEGPLAAQRWRRALFHDPTRGAPAEECEWRLTCSD